MGWTMRGGPLLVHRALVLGTASWLLGLCRAQAVGQESDLAVKAMEVLELAHPPLVMPTRLTSNGDGTYSGYQYINGNPYNLTYSPSPVHVDDFSIQVGTLESQTIESAQLANNTIFRGVIEGLPDISLIAHIDTTTNKFQSGRIFGPNIDMVAEVVSGDLLGAPVDQVVLYNSSDAARGGAQPGTENANLDTDIELFVPSGIMRIQSTAKSPPKFARDLKTGKVVEIGGPGTMRIQSVSTPTFRVARILADTDPEFITRWKGKQAAQRRIEQLVAMMNVQYERDIKATHIITKVILRDGTTGNPFTSRDTGELLGQFVAEWTKPGVDSTIFDLAILFSGKTFINKAGGQPAIGLAYTGGLCIDGFKYSVTEHGGKRASSFYADLVAHEVGHLWGVSHCTQSGWICKETMTPAVMSYLRFLSKSQTKLVENKKKLSCLGTMTGCQKDTHCDDGKWCNGQEVCKSNVCVAGKPPCSGQKSTCDETNDKCVECVRDSDCSNGKYCDGVEQCVKNTCTSGKDPCGPGFRCTESAKSCTKGPVACGNQLCEKGEDCNSCPKDCKKSKANVARAHSYCCGNGKKEIGEYRTGGGVCHNNF